MRGHIKAHNTQKKSEVFECINHSVQDSIVSADSTPNISLEALNKIFSFDSLVKKMIV